MVKPNSFYRFEQAWSAGFWPDNQIVADLLNEMYSYINAQLATWVNVGTTTFPSLSGILRSYTDLNNAYPYYGGFEFRSYSLTATSFTITISNLGLIATDNTQEIVITGTMDAGTQVINAMPTLAPFTPGVYSGSFGATLINEEKRVAEALEVVYQNGSALFPITYSYNPSTKIATSGLARGSNWKLWDDIEPNRLPYPTIPNTNRRTFSLPQLNADDQYVVSIMERVIQASLADTDYLNSVLIAINSFTAPDGWTITINHPTYTSYERVQVTYSDDSGRRKFILVGRLDTAWLWQRFVSDESGAAYDFLATYTETTALPYEVNQAGRWLYNSNTYDYEFVEFNSGCYESLEFYPMPAKPGDQWQFNVDKQDANITGLDYINVGLFTHDGSFIQKVGEVNVDSVCCCNPYVFTATYTSEQLNDIRLSINSNIGSSGYLYYFYISIESEILSYTSEPLPNDYIETPADLNNYFSSFGGPFVFSVNISGSDWETATGTITITTIGLDCTSEQLFMHQTVTSEPINPYNASIFSYTGGCDYVNYSQGYALATIPSKSGCYRLGLYNDPTTTCTINFTYTLEGSALTDYLNIMNESYVGLNPYFSWIVVTGDQFTYTVQSFSTTALDVASWCNANIPGMIVTTTEDSMTFNYTRSGLPCGEAYALSNCQTDALAETCLIQLWVTPEENCECGTTGYLYSLSNIIKIDASDCFSTMLEFWSDNNTINSGFEYQNNWKQRVRLGINGGGEKPVIEESLYRQSNGVHRRPQSKQDLSLDLHTDFLDLPTQLALVDATRHPYLVWNGKNIFVKGDVEVATIQDFTTQSSFETLAQVKFQALLQGFQPGNSSCLTC